MSLHTLPSTSLKRLTAVWSRDVNTSRLAGRTQIIRAIREEMLENYLAQHLRVQNLLERRSFTAIAGTVATALRSIFTRGKPSLQCLLFCDTSNLNDIRKHLEGNPPAILYCDGVRIFYLLRNLAHLREQMRIVVDFDDLMSRRMQSLGTAQTTLSLGYLHDKMPSWLTRAIGLGWISKIIARYEEAALTDVENSIGQWADVVVLISQVEGNILESRYQHLGCKAKVHVIPPPVEIVAPPQTYSVFSRFIFIGTDALPQNKLTIQLILDLWRSNRPTTEIHIFGHMVSSWPPVPGVVFRGYAPSLHEVYAEGSVLLSPGVLRGGLKTKVAEAFSYGCAVIGNEVTFEGLHLIDYPLLLNTDEELSVIMKNPSSYLHQMQQAASVGQDYVKVFLSRKSFEENWKDALG